MRILLDHIQTNGLHYLFPGDYPVMVAENTDEVASLLAFLSDIG